jgi:predicted MFS family arabinose efflux permease
MIPLRYDRARWVIAVLTLLLVILFAVLQPTGGASILFVLLILLSAGAIVLPPGIYIWLLRPACPECGSRVQVTVEQGSKNPYWERVIMHCPDCDNEQIEFSFDPT